MLQSQSCPATNTAIQLSALMGVIGVGAMKMTEAAQDVARQRQDDSVFQSYADALERAKLHVAEIEIVASHAVRRVTDLEAECARLRTACLQREEVIEALMSGRA